MPTVLRIGPYRFFFFSADGVEPPHVHIERDRALAKFWLRPARLAQSKGFPAAEIRALERLVDEHEATILEKWDEYFSA
jgi:hypothetical protein